MSGPEIEPWNLCNSTQELYHWASQANIHGTYSPNYYIDKDFCTMEYIIANQFLNRTKIISISLRAS